MTQPENDEKRLVGDFEQVCRLIRKLILYSNNEWSRELAGNTSILNKRARHLYDDLIKGKPPITKQDFDMLLKDAENRSIELPSPIYLPPLSMEADYIPILKIKCYFAIFPPEVKLRLGLMRLLDIPPESTSDTWETAGIGFRYESAHETGSHSYDHAQICADPFDEDNFNKKLNCPPWLPMSWPAFAMPGNNPISLVVGLLISLYGRKSFDILEGLKVQNYLKVVHYLFDRNRN